MPLNEDNVRVRGLQAILFRALLCRPPFVAGFVAAVDDAAGADEEEGVGVLPPPPALLPGLLLPRPPVLLPVLVLPPPGGVVADAAGVLEDAVPLAGTPPFPTAEDAAGGAWEAPAAGGAFFPPPAPAAG